MEEQSLENAQLRREKAVVENDLLKTQVGIKKFSEIIILNKWRIDLWNLI